MSGELPSFPPHGPLPSSLFQMFGTKARGRSCCVVSRPGSLRTWCLLCPYPHLLVPPAACGHPRTFSDVWWHHEIEIHYSDVIMGMMASQMTSLTIVYSILYSGTGQRNHQSSTSLAFVWGIHRSPMNSPHKWPVTRKMFPFSWCHHVFRITGPLWGQSTSYWWIPLSKGQ